MKRESVHSVSIIPNEREFNLVTPSWDGSTIIAWRIETYESDDGDFRSTVYPITTDGCPIDVREWAIRLPDGSVEEPFGGLFKTLADYQKARQQENGDG